MPKEDYQLACMMLAEYVRTVTPEHFENPIKSGNASNNSAFSKADKRKRRSSKSKRSKRSSTNANPDELWGDSITPPMDLEAHGKYQ